jgi:EAL domain-containing protein (putative c-di-GMP-specific phosphodiesterase class I)
VEDLDTADVLAGLRCDTAQGYHYTAPVPADELTRWLQASNDALVERQQPVG